MDIWKFDGPDLSGLLAQAQQSNSDLQEIKEQIAVLVSSKRALEEANRQLQGRITELEATTVERIFGDDRWMLQIDHWTGLNTLYLSNEDFFNVANDHWSVSNYHDRLYTSDPVKLYQAIEKAIVEKSLEPSSPEVGLLDVLHEIFAHKSAEESFAIHFLKFWYLGNKEGK